VALGGHHRLGDHSRPDARCAARVRRRVRHHYTVSGTDSARGLDTLNASFPQQGGYGGQIVFHAKHGTVTASKSAVNQATSNVAKLPHVIGATSPFASSNSGQISEDGTITYTSASWNVNPDSLGNSYLDKLNKAVVSRARLADQK
jgi:putative drug exporter of the RND superfamily